jgi:hypothetical protein
MHQQQGRVDSVHMRYPLINRLEQKEFKADSKSCKHGFSATNGQWKKTAIKIYNIEKLKVEQKEFFYFDSLIFKQALK